MSFANKEMIAKRTLEAMIQTWSQISILQKQCSYNIGEGKCCFGGILKCLTEDTLQNQNFPHNCKESVLRLCIDSVKTVQQVAEVYSEELVLIDTPSLALLQFLENEKEKQSQR